MDPKTIDAAKVALTPLFKKLSELGQAGYEVMLRQNYVNSVICIIWIVISIGLIIAVWAVGHTLIKKLYLHPSGIVAEGVDPDEVRCYKSDRISFWWMVTIGRWLVTALLIFASILPYSEALAGRLINPNYYAIKDMIQLVSPPQPSE